MANPVTGHSMPAQVQQTFCLKILTTPTPNMCYNYLADPELMPKHGGNYMVWSRYNPLPAAVVDLGDSGADPAAADFSRVDITAKLGFYGQYIIINQQVQLHNQDSVLNAASKRLGVSLRLTEDTLLRNMLLSSAARIYCTGGILNDSPTEITASDIDVAIQSLIDANSWVIQDKIESENKFGIAAQRASYLCVMHTKVRKDLEKCDEFTPVSRYPSPTSILRTEWGSVTNFRFHLTTNGAVIPNSSLNGRDVYAASFAGLENSACVKQDGLSSRFIYLPPEIAGGHLAQNCSVGWSSMQAFAIKNDTWVGNLMCTITP